MAQVAPEASAMMTFTVQVPDNAPPGALVQFTAPNGQSVQAQIPPGLGPGAQFTIAVPAAVQQQHGPDAAVGVAEEGGLRGVLRGLDGVEYVPRKDRLAGQDFTVHATDQVVDVFALDRAMFDAAIAAKRRLHVCSGGTTRACICEDCSCCPGSSGALVDENPLQFSHLCVVCPLPECSQAGLCLSPVCLRAIVGMPCFLAAALHRALCSPHRDMAWPPWADRALVLTDRGLIGRRRMLHDPGLEARPADGVMHERHVNAILWENFDLEKTRQSVRVYATSPTCYRDDKYKFSPHNYCNPEFPFMEMDPLTLECGFGVCVPCVFCVCCQPRTPGLYHVTIRSHHVSDVVEVYTSEGGEGSGDGSYSWAYRTAEIDLIGLSRSPEDLMNALEAGYSKYGAPPGQVMERGGSQKETDTPGCGALLCCGSCAWSAESEDERRLRLALSQTR